MNLFNFMQIDDFSKTKNIYFLPCGKTCGNCGKLANHCAIRGCGG
jgi:hypothetical protein